METSVVWFIGFLSYYYGTPKHYRTCKAGIVTLIFLICPAKLCRLIVSRIFIYLKANHIVL